jgi:BMFP domain-containing protein YqiC
VRVQLLKQRVSQLENTAQQTDVVRQENALLRQQLAEMEAAVSCQPCSNTHVSLCCFGAAGTPDLWLYGPPSPGIQASV